jgi:hypothetical protein
LYRRIGQRSPDNPCYLIYRAASVDNLNIEIREAVKGPVIVIPDFTLHFRFVKEFLFGAGFSAGRAQFRRQLNKENPLGEGKVVKLKDIIHGDIKGLVGYAGKKIAVREYCFPRSYTVQNPMPAFIQVKGAVRGKKAHKGIMWDGQFLMEDSSNKGPDGVVRWLKGWKKRRRKPFGHPVNTMKLSCSPGTIETLDDKKAFDFFHQFLRGMEVIPINGVIYWYNSMMSSVQTRRARIT